MWLVLSDAVSDYSDLTRRLADLIVQFGANVQPGQLLGVTSYVGKEELTREIARSAYARGAKFVDVGTPTSGSSGSGCFTAIRRRSRTSLPG